MKHLSKLLQKFKPNPFAAHLKELPLARREFAALLEFLQAQGCSFHSCQNLGANPVPKGIAFRYDIHERDIRGAYVFMEAHLRLNIPATFFLMWDYTDHEREHAADFLALAKHIAPPVEVGLHDSPVDAYLVTEKFGGSRHAYWDWLRSGDAVTWLDGLAQDPAAIAALHAAVLESFIIRAQETTKRFGRSVTVASHGGELSQGLRKQMPDMAPATAALLSGLFAETWMTKERVQAAGLIADVEQYKRNTKGWVQVTDGGGKITAMMDTLHRYAFVGSSAAQFLIHPYTWDGAVRDSEITTRLAMPPYAAAKKLAAA